MKIIIFISIIIFMSSCNKAVQEYIIISDKVELKEILNKNYKNENKNCRWEYAHTKQDHIFLLSCIPKKNQSSFYSVAKRYKINKKYLTVDNTYKVFDKKNLIRMNNNEDKITIGIPLNMINIHW